MDDMEIKLRVPEDYEIRLNNGQWESLAHYTIRPKEGECQCNMHPGRSGWKR